MSLIDFIREKGSSIFGTNDDHATQETSAINLIRQKGLQVDNLSVQVNNGAATISGLAHSQADKEQVVLLVGNINGVASVKDNLTVTTAGDASQMYTVKEGDSLSKIAGEVYGDVMSYNRIFDANKTILDDPDHIYPGQVLRIPAKA